jgi:DNA-binding MarR family transcriptional regulator
VPTTTSPFTRDGSRLSTEELAAWRGFLRVHAALRKELDAELVAAHDLPLSSYEVLLFLDDAPGGRMRMSELASSVLLSRSGLTRLVDRLERAGIVQREDCDTDARGMHAVITKRGRRALGAARTTHLAGVRERFLDVLDDDERRVLAELWERMVPGATMTAAAAAGGC